jgi:hypothetical protein
MRLVERARQDRQVVAVAVDARNRARRPAIQGCTTSLSSGARRPDCLSGSLTTRKKGMPKSSIMRARPP